MYNEQLGSPYLIMHGIMLISLEGGGKMGDIAASMYHFLENMYFSPLLSLLFSSFVFHFFLSVFCRRNSIFKGCLANHLVLIQTVSLFG